MSQSVASCLLLSAWAVSCLVLRADGVTVFLRSETPDGMEVLEGVGAAAKGRTPEADWAKSNMRLLVGQLLTKGYRPSWSAMSNVVRVAAADAAGNRRVSLDRPNRWELECPWLDVTREYARLCIADGGEGGDLRVSGVRLFNAIVHAYWGAPGDLRLKLADPHVLTWKGRYYAYGTTDPRGFRAFVSDDLVHWTPAKGLSDDGLVFSRGDGYGTREFWAPEVHAYKGRFYLFYSANRCCCVAVADSPLGPFRNPKHEPLFARPGGQAIDNSLFVDDDGKPWMPFSDNERLAFVRLTPDLMSVVPDSLFVAFDKPRDAWQKGTEEGPSVVRVGGKYVVLFSGDGCQSQDYAVGVGVADRVTGPWTRVPGYRFLHRAGGLMGTGHGSPLRLTDGSWRYVFHAHETSAIMGCRRMYVVPMDFEGCIPRMTGEPVACLRVTDDRIQGGEAK